MPQGSEQLPRSTRYLQAALKKYLLKDGRLLDVGSASGKIAREWVSQGHSATYSHYQLPACHQVARGSGMVHTPPTGGVAQGNDPWLWAGDITGLSIAFTDGAPAGPYALGTFDTREYETPYALEMMGHIAAALASDGCLLAAIDGTIAITAWREQLKSWFQHVQELVLDPPQPRDLQIFLAQEPIQGKKPHIHYWPWQAALGEQVYDFWGAPGVFSPRGLDTGTAHMLEIMEVSPQARFLDLGSGTGVVSVIANRDFQASVYAVDTNARALRLTAMNCQKNMAGDVEIQPSDGLVDIHDSVVFDVIACNPPYHTDFGVARRLMEGAFQRLREGGKLYLVVKRADWYERKLESLFGGFQRHTRGDYMVLVSERRPNSSKDMGIEEHAEAGTKKHLKRLERTKRRKRVAGRRR